ncbi:LytR/AlgR family response regulator transcription factor [Adhaeribacter soli]|uniref:Response regulator transcription factor n=1 Tax=Adhaeribacter soli TaxID=2607655 RepID=A0A5N1J5W1_9BACT|nr:LytTR family DNA-binding domain-containing protein [Adhaeribacter soli]KAA9346080.1 response regulator transcription factor [Adhaeribacter soli]
MKLRCLLVDDEPLAHKVLENYIGQVGSLVVAGNCYTALEAFEFLNRQPVDILFLDINMPGMTGTTFLKTFEVKPAVIMTTAYRDYAVDGFEHDVTDFLLKPFALERFLKAVQKVQKQQVTSVQSNLNASDAPVAVYLKAGNEVIRLLQDELLYVEGLKEYLKLHRISGTMVYKGSFRQIEEAFPPRTFLRIHKSFLVSVKHLANIRGNEVKVGEKWLPVGRSYKMQVQQFLETFLLK